MIGIAQIAPRSNLPNPGTMGVTIVLSIRGPVRLVAALTSMMAGTMAIGARGMGANGTEVLIVWNQKLATC